MSAAKSAPRARQPAGDTLPDALEAYRHKRDFSKTSEPEGASDTPAARPARRAFATGGTSARFVIQKHWARRLHYDFRLEIGGTLKSWAVPKGPSLDPSVKRMAVQVEDHPLEYGDFEGTIPAGQYGAGKVIIWDKGQWQPDGDPTTAYAEGKIRFSLDGGKLQGRWALVRTGKRSAAAGKGAPTKQAPTHWLLIKEKDAHARAEAEFDVTEALPHSVKTQVTLTTPAMQNADTAMPDTLAPQLATRVSTPPASGGWRYELKYDGYRILTRVHQGRARLFTRNGHDWTARLPDLAQAFESNTLPDGWYDGEIVVLDDAGRPDFHALQNAFGQTGRKTGARASGPARAELVYFLFDLLWLQDQDLRPLPLTERQARLATLLDEAQHPALRLSTAFDAPGQDMVKSACQLGLEGVIGKRSTAPYVSGRSGHWIKLKCAERQEFVIGGYTEPQGGRNGLGALLLGYYDDSGALHYAGKVGSGFDDATLHDLHSRLQRLHQEHAPFFRPPRTAGTHWVRPELAAEVSFSQWTESGSIRHGVYLGLREDKPPTLMKKEHAQAITHSDRLVDPHSGARKGDIATYYERIAPLILPHLQDRPVSMVRAPEGLRGELFFQKHMAVERLSGLMQLDPELDPGHDPLVVVRNAAGLAQAAQLNVIEFHTWNAQRSRIDRPDRISFDLDPGKGVEWPAMQEAATLLRSFLHELGLPAFLKTSGGKGLHVAVPIVRRYDWDTAKGFSKAVVQHMADVLPRQFSAKSGPRNRVGKIFIDYLRNGFGATTVAAWSLRARPGMGVSVPVHWDELDQLRSGDHWNLQNIDERLEIGNQPWDEYSNSAVALGTAMKMLGFKK